MRTDKEIFRQIDEASKRIEEGNLLSFMSYKDGIKAALEWVIDESVTSPFDNEDDN